MFGVLGFGEDEHGADGDGDAVESDEACLASIAGQEGVEGLSEEGGLEPVVEDGGSEAEVGSCLGEGAAVVEDVVEDGLLFGGEVESGGRGARPGRGGAGDKEGAGLRWVGFGLGGDCLHGSGSSV